MSYSPRHGGGQKKTAPKTEPSESSRSAGRSASDNKKKSKALVIALLVIFSAAIIVALVFLLKPALTPDDTVAPGSTEAATATSEYSGSYTSPNPVLQYSGGEIPTSGSRHDVTVIPDGGVDAMEIIGTWYVDDWTAYIFDGYGRGVMIASNNNYTFAYSAQNGLLIVDYDDDKGMDTEYDYVLDGDNLTLKRGNSEYNLTKELEPKQTEEPTQVQVQDETVEQEQ